MLCLVNNVGLLKWLLLWLVWSQLCLFWQAFTRHCHFNHKIVNTRELGVVGNHEGMGVSIQIFFIWLCGVNSGCFSLTYHKTVPSLTSQSCGGYLLSACPGKMETTPALMCVRQAEEKSTSRLLNFGNTAHMNFYLLYPSGGGKK